MYAVPDLPGGVADLAASLGVTPAAGGSHPGAGTHNALLSLGDLQYLEVIAPDPAQSLAGTLGQQIRDRNCPEIRTWAAGTDDLDSLCDTVESLGLEYRQLDMSRATPEGQRLEWSLLFVSGHDFGDLFPFFIDWRDSPHPATTSPGGCRLERFTIKTEAPTEMLSLLDTFDIEEIDVQPGTPRLAASMSTPNGEIWLT